MSIPGTVPVTGPVAPTATTDTYPAQLEEYNKGGYRTVVDNTERDAITAPRRKEGMLVYVTSTGITWQLEAGLTTWTESTVNGIATDDLMLISVYDPNDDGIVANSDNLQSQNGAYYLARANHSGTQAQNTVVNLVADLALKLNASALGVTVAELVAGTVPIAQLPFSSTAYLGVYNANTNTPVLANGVGVAGQWVWTTVAGAAGPQGATALNEAVVYDGAVWQVGPAVTGSIGSVVTDLGTQTGATVTIDDTSYIAPSANRNYLTDDQLAAMPAGATALDPLVLQSDLSSIIVVGNGVFLPELYSDGQTLGDGTARTLASLGYSNGSAGAYWTRVNSAYTIDVNTDTIDWIAWQESQLAMSQQGYQAITTPGGRGYVVNKSISLPLDQTAIAFYRRSKMWKYDFNASSFRGTSAIRIFDKYPVNQAQAAGLQLDYAYKFSNGTFYGFGTNLDSDCAIRLGGTAHSSMVNMEMSGFGISADWQFCLETYWNEIKIGNYGLYGLRLGVGLWSGSGTSISASNVSIFDIIRFVSGNGKTPTAALYFTGASHYEVNSPIFEGFSGSIHHILYDNLGGNAKYNLVINNAYFEAAGATRAGIRFRSNAGTCILNGFDLVYADVAATMPCLIEAEGISQPSRSPLYMKIENSPAWNSGWKFRQIDTNKWVVTDVKLVNDASLISVSNWLTDFGGSIPSSALVRYTPRL